ncbi:MAG TPA: glycosyltransferase [Bacillota bacterium]|nr:glycosyltransferase [Bacillota bacterium]HPZ41378.1 glycosyltransferase [Bacillota bacterium]HQD51645.1 glycosyltransferase [Bacillota bacterium]
MELTIRFIGLIVALLYVIFSIDDIIWDIAHFVKKRVNTEEDQLPLEKLDAIPPKLLAVIIAAWHEERVLELVIENMLASIQYPQSMYHIFVGVYPNDDATVAVAKRLEKKHQNVHMVINTHDGPTCKADNINNVIAFIKQFEDDRDWRFSSITVHDAEDVVHPYELKVTNYLLDHYDSLQFPVFPLQRMPTLKNFFSSMTSGTYADEFAENHFRMMKMREAMSAIVPSAGTGFVISRRILEQFGDQPLFPEDTLTEDYKLSIALAQKGFHVHYVLEKVQRLLDDGTVKWEYIATRSIFPATFKKSVQQRTRWIYGISMQSVKFADIFKPSEIGFAGRYTLYKDLKAKFVNLLLLPGYLIFIYFIISQFVSIPIMYPIYTFSWWLCVLLTIIMLLRQIIRAIAIRNVYGFKSMVFACLLPPLMPIRLVWGNIINLSATLCAWKQLIFGFKKGDKEKKVTWNKTDHEFLDKHILYRYYRNIGDLLLEKQYIDVDSLDQFLEQSRKEGLRLGDLLLQNSIITEEQLMIAVASSQHKLFVKNISSFISNTVDEFDKHWLEQSLIYPLLKTKNGYVFAETNFTPPDTFENLKTGGAGIHTVFTTKAKVLEAINSHGTASADSSVNLVTELLLQDKITWEQAVLALDNQNFIPDILGYMGLRPAKVKIERSLGDAINA